MWYKRSICGPERGTVAWLKGVVSWCPTQGFPPGPQLPPGNVEVLFNNTAAHLVPELDLCITLGKAAPYPGSPLPGV